MTEKRASGKFTEIIAYEAPARDVALPGVWGVIIKLLTSNGRHIGTVHDIVDKDKGAVRESHPHDYTLRDCSRVRIIQKQEAKDESE